MRSAFTCFRDKIGYEPDLLQHAPLDRVAVGADPDDRVLEVFAQWGNSDELQAVVGLRSNVL
jgi:hypothetical protein